MFKPDRMFSQRNPNTGEIDWFFNAREGTFGPYSSKANAQKILEEFVALRVSTNDDGGRGAKQSRKLALEAMSHTDAPRYYEPLQPKKGKTT